MTRTLACAAVLSLCGALAVPAQTISGGAGQTATPTGGRGGQQPGAPPPRDRAAQAQTGTARIRGRVAAADTGAPVRRANVMLNGPIAPRSTTTDGDGRFEFNGLPAGSYNLNANKPGFINQLYGQRRLNAPNVPVAVRDGQTVSQIDFALMRGGVVTGRISDDFGDPLAGAQMQVQRYTYGPNGRQLTGVAAGPSNFITDDLGQFRIYGLAPGDYVVSGRVQTSLAQVPNQDDRGEGYPPTFYPGTANIAESQLVTVSASQETAVHFAMTASRLVRLSGRVMDSQGRPAAGAMLQLSSGTQNSGLTIGAGQVAPDGTFSIARVPPGDHVIRVSSRPQNNEQLAQRLDQLVRAGGVLSVAGEEPEVGTLPVSVSGEDLTGLTLQMRRAAVLSGRFVLEGSSARPNLEQMRVTLQTADQAGAGSVLGGGIIGGSGQQNGQPDANGAFELRGAAGRVLLRVIGNGAWTLKSVMLRGVDITDTPLDVIDDVEGLRLVLTDRVTEASGTVVNAATDAPDGFAVVILPREEIEGIAGARYTRVSKLSRPDRFSVRGLPAGDYVAAAFEWLDPGQEWDPRIREAVRASGERFSLAEDRPSTLSLRLTPVP
jgi:protocatechuate 3,4-dioxygenase beta subunit